MNECLHVCGCEHVHIAHVCMKECVSTTFSAPLSSDVVVEYDPSAHDLKTISMHAFEDQEMRDGMTVCVVLISLSLLYLYHFAPPSLLYIILLLNLADPLNLSILTTSMCMCVASPEHKAARDSRGSQRTACCDAHTRP